jgi:hypothetical protein
MVLLFRVPAITLPALNVAERLGSPPDLVQAWLDGHATIPDRKCAALLDLMGEIGE